LKILFIHTYYRHRGGEDTVFENEIVLLRQHGHEVDSICFYNKHLTLLKFFLLPFNYHSYRKVRKKLREFKPDIVHMHNFYFGGSPAIVRAVKKEGLPLVHTLHNFRLLCPSAFLFYRKKVFLTSLDESFPWTAIRKGVYRDSVLLTLWLTFSIRLYNKIFGWKSIDRFIALNDDTKIKFVNSYLKIEEKQIEVKTNFVEDFNTLDLPRGDHFLYAGRLSEEKGIDVLLNAFSKTDAKLTIIGDGPLRPDVEEVIRERTNITYLGFCKKDIVRKELQKCTCLIFPSIWFECAPMIIMEAFACNTPVIASNMGAMETIVSEGVNGLHFEPGDAEDLKDKVNFWNGLDKASRDKFYRQTRSEYEKYYTPERSLEKTLSIYNSVIHEKSINS
jgi:glycosyltransferase involved in cell wall biosynthesis